MPLILMQLAEALCFLVDSRSFLSAGQDLPHTSKNAHAPGQRIDGHRLNSTHEATDTASLSRDFGAKATVLFLFMPYFIHNQSYFHTI